MVQVIATNCTSLASSMKSNALKLKSGPLQDVLAQGAEKSEERRSITWPRGVDKTQLLDGIAFGPTTYLQSFSLDEVGHHFVCPYDSDSVSLVSVAGPDIRVVAPAPPRDVYAGLATLLQPTEAAPPIQAKYEWEQAAFAAFCAIVDRIRALFASSLVLRQGVETIAFSRDELEEQLKAGAGQSDYRWLCAMLPHLLIGGTSPLRMLAAGCAQLEEEGLLTSHKEAGQTVMTPSTALVNIALQLVNPLPAIIISPASAASKQADGITAIFGGQTFWCVANRRRTVALESIGGLEALSWLSANLEFPKTIGAKEPEAVKTNGSGAGIEGHHATEAPDLTCKQCGATLRSSLKFCTGCGAPVSSQH